MWKKITFSDLVNFFLAYESPLKLFSYLRYLIFGMTFVDM